MVLDRTFTHTSPTLLDHDTRGYRESMVITDEQDDIEDSPFEKRQFNHRAESVFASEFDDDDDDDVDDVDDDVDDNKSDITKSQNARDHMSVLGDDDRDKDGSDNVEKDLLKVDLKEKLFESQKEIRTEEESEYGGGLGDGLSFGDFW